MKYLILTCLSFISNLLFAQAVSEPESKKPTSSVNVFLGSSGDHGQLSPAASYPFSMLSIGPQTYPSTHTGYEHLAKKFLGFTHNRFEGVGCMGSGGNLLIKPFLGTDPEKSELIKAKEQASPGYYNVGFTNHITAEFSVFKNEGRHRYQLPKGDKGFEIDLSHSFVNRFVAEEHAVKGAALSGWIEAKTTCDAGIYRIYYYLEFSESVKWQTSADHKLTAIINPDIDKIEIRIGFSSTSTDYAKQSASKLSFDQLRSQSDLDWIDHLNRIVVKGDPEREKLFYSLLYRTIQSPYQISEPDGTYRAINGSLQHSENKIYNGWAIWDNYRTQLPLLSIAYPERYQDISSSIANLYLYGKKDFATMKEPSPTVRTEHAIVVLLDAWRKGYKINLNQIVDSLIREVDHLDYSTPDKALESSYDAWALSQILAILGKKESSEKYRQKALEYKTYWNKDFKDILSKDVDKMQARGLYQGTIWQYRWFVPFDLKGLADLTGGEEAFGNQLDAFFKNDYYNHANEPDLQVPLMYNATQDAWKSQALIHHLAVDTVVQHYFNDNSRGIGSFIDRIYKNESQAYIRTMDDDAGAMSSWFILTSAGISPACVGWPVYYLNVPLFESVKFNWQNGKTLSIHVENFADQNYYIKEVRLNGKKLDRNWITQKEISNGGKLTIVATDQPQKVKNIWMSDINMKAE